MKDNPSFSGILQLSVPIDRPSTASSLPRDRLLPPTRWLWHLATSRSSPLQMWPSRPVSVLCIWDFSSVFTCFFRRKTYSSENRDFLWPWVVVSNIVAPQTWWRISSGGKYLYLIFLFFLSFFLFSNNWLIFLLIGHLYLYLFLNVFFRHGLWGYLAESWTTR